MRNQHFIIKKSHGHTNSLILCTLKFGEEVQPPTGRDKDRCHERIHGDANNSDFDREHFFLPDQNNNNKKVFHQGLVLLFSH